MATPRIQDDLYEHVNGEWLSKAVIPDDKPCAGGFSELAREGEELLMKEFRELAASGNLDDANMKKAVSLYRLCLDEKRRAEDGIKPAQDMLDTIDSLKDIDDLNAHLVQFVEEGYPLPFKMTVETDFKDSSSYGIALWGAPVFLPDSNYYKDEMAEQKKQLMPLFVGMAEKLLAKTKLSEADQALYIKDALAFDELIAKYVKSQEEWADYVAAYNPIHKEKAAAFFKPVDLTGLLGVLFPIPFENVIFTEPRYFEHFSEVFNEETFTLYKHWAYLSALIDVSSTLTEEMRDIGSSFGRALSGVAVMPSLEKQSYNLASFFFSDVIGLYYGRKFFGEAAKKDITELVQSIIEAWKDRVRKNAFLSDSTKDKAILKLGTMKLKLAYPDKTDALYDTLVVDESLTLFENCQRLKKAKKIDELKKFGTKVDHSKWDMPGHMVNACYNPASNDITFPAAILQAPFYSIKQTRSENLGGIGCVIAHEISHAFDNNGAQFDENGNLNNWWTDEDMANFKAQTLAMVEQFDGIELPWGKVNGEFIVSENIADNGGMAASLQVMHGMKDADYKAFFMNWGRIWCQKAKVEYDKLLLSIDVHAPHVLRANITPRNFGEWYTAFDVKESDKMYLPPEKRVVIW